MVRSSLGAIVAMAVLSLAAGQQLNNDEFSLLGIPRPGGVPMMGLPVMNINNLMEDIMKDFAEEPSSSAAAPARTRMHVIHLPPMMSGLFRRDSTEEESPQTARPAATMQFGPLSMRIMSRPLGQLKALSSNCVPCGRVQSHMRSISIMHGPNGQRVETVTETGPDGEEHTTRTVMTDEAKPASGAASETGSDLLDAILSPLMGGIPNFERIMQDAPALEKEEAKLAPPAAAPEPIVARKAEVSEEEAKQAVKTAVTAEGLKVDSPEKRKELAHSIAKQLGVAPDAVKVSSKDEDADQSKDEEEEDVVEKVDSEDEDADADADMDPVGKEMDMQQHSDDDADAEEDEPQNADELGKEFQDEEEEKADVMRRESKTLTKVSEAVRAARREASKADAAADDLEALRRHMQSLSRIN